MLPGQDFRRNIIGAAYSEFFLIFFFLRGFLVKRLETIGLVGEASRHSLNSTVGGVVFCREHGAGGVDRPFIADALR